MPKKVERRLRREAEEKFPGDKERQDTYVYGELNNLGLMHGNKTVKKKHDDDEHDYRE